MRMRWGSMDTNADSIAVASVNKSYFAGEFDWTGSTDGGVTTNGDSLVDWFDIIEKSPVAAGDAFWSLFGHDVPNCNVSNNSSMMGCSSVRDQIDQQNPPCRAS